MYFSDKPVLYLNLLAYPFRWVLATVWLSKVWGSALSSPTRPYGISVISTARWLTDAWRLYSQSKSNIELIECIQWSQEATWPDEATADIRVLVLSPDDELSLHCLKAAKRASQTLPTLALCTQHDDVWMKRLFRDHVQAYLTLDQSQADIEQAFALLLKGDTHVPQPFISAFINDTPPRPLRLSNREKTIARLLVSGHSHQAIAEQLHISDKTVSTHKTNILDRLGLKHLPDLVRFHDKYPMAFKYTQQRKKQPDTNHS